MLPYDRQMMITRQATQPSICCIYPQVQCTFSFDLFLYFKKISPKPSTEIHTCMSMFIVEMCSTAPSHEHERSVSLASPQTVTGS